MKTFKNLVTGAQDKELDEARDVVVEAVTNKGKLQQLVSAQKHLKAMMKDIDSLSKMDDDDNHSGYGDLHDQLVTFDKLTLDLKNVIDRTSKVIPKQG